MKVLVIGASGFLGSAIARACLQDGHEVFGSYVHGQQNIPEGCTAIAFSDVDSLDTDFDVVAIAAGNHALPPQELVDVNTEVPRKLMRQFPSTKIMFVSSIAVYGNHDDVMTEHSEFDNPSPYGWAKLAGEAIVRTHPKYAIVRPTYLYGKNMPDNSFVPAIIAKAKTEKQITLFGKGERLNDYLHVDDAAELCLRAIKHPENETFLAASGRSYSNTEVAEAICKHIPDCTLNYSGTDTAPWFQFHPQDTKETLNWKPKHQFDVAIEELI